jgi:hypothetical protein
MEKLIFSKQKMYYSQEMTVNKKELFFADRKGLISDTEELIHAERKEMLINKLKLYFIERNEVILNKQKMDCGERE